MTFDPEPRRGRPVASWIRTRWCRTSPGRPAAQARRRSRLVHLIEQGTLSGFTSTDVLADVAHRLMTLEAIAVNGWPYAGIAARLRKHHHFISKLTIFRQAIASFPQLNIQVIPITQPLLEAATLASQQFELLTGDALVVAVMQAQGLTHLASNDADFDPGKPG